jgi:hypothetical protein
MFSRALVIKRDTQAFLTLVWYSRHAKDSNIYAYADDGQLVSQWKFSGAINANRAEHSMEHHMRNNLYPLCPYTREEILMEGLTV